MAYPIAERSGGLNLDQMAATHEFLASKGVLFLYGPIMSMVSETPGWSRSDMFSSGVLTDTILALSLHNPAKPIYLIIDSPGGSIADGYHVLDIMNTVRAPVRTIGRNCLSMAAVILSGGEKGHRYLFPNAKVMLHLASATISGDTKDMAIRTKLITKTQDAVADLLITNGVKKSKKELLKDIDRERWWTAEEAIEYGLADKLVQNGMFEQEILGV